MSLCATPDKRVPGSEPYSMWTFAKNRRRQSDLKMRYKKGFGRNWTRLQSVRSLSVWPPQTYCGNKVALTQCCKQTGGRWAWPGSSCLSPFISRLLLKRTLMHSQCQWGRGESKGICAYHTTLSIRWRELAARGSVGESTCILSAEERMSESSSAGIVGGGEGEKKLAPARHRVSGRFWSFSQESSIVLNTSSSLFLCFSHA